MKLGYKDIKGVVGIVPTPATADAGSWRTENSIAFDQTEKMIESIAAAGVDIILTTGTFGECATLTWKELRAFVACVVDTSKKRCPVFAGVTTLNTRDTITRGRALVDAGADGLFVGRPMWVPLDDGAIVRYYRDIAEALPGVPIVVYDNPIAFKGKISTDAYRQLATIPEVVAAKHIGGPPFEQDLLAVGDRIVLLPLESDWYGFAKKFPERTPACWSGNVACGPAPVVALARAIQARDWAAAERISERINWAISAQFGNDFGRFMTYSMQIGHARFRSAGLIDPGPTRPPYIDAPEDCLAGGLETGRRWGELQREFADLIAATA